MSKKSVPFFAPEGAARPASAAAARRRGHDEIEARSDEWVSDRNDAANRTARPWADLVIDLAAERSLTEVVALSMLAPLALGWFWLMNAMSGRARF